MWVVKLREGGELMNGFGIPLRLRGAVSKSYVWLAI